MSLNINRNTSKASDTVIHLEANEAVERSRFSHSSVQSTGDVFVSNKPWPSADTSSGDWVQLSTEVETGSGMYNISMPVVWVASTAEAWVCSYVSGDL